MRQSLRQSHRLRGGRYVDDGLSPP
jgi:hypothetical protein